MAVALLEQDAEVEIEYAPRGAIREMFHRRDPEIVVSGPAGTGKSRGILEKTHLALSRHDGARGLMVRKTHNSLKSSGLVTFREEVLHPLDLQQGVVHFFSGNSERPAQYEYKNGSVFVVGGLDDPNKVMSTQYDIICVLEATELAERDWEQLNTRCRNGVMPYQQMIADVNPGPPHHWLKRRCDRGAAALLYSWHKDNPVLFNEDGTMTADGVAYMRRLDNLTGVRRARLRDGRWVQAEGVVYDTFERDRHIIYRAQVPKTWEYIVGVDWGYTNAGAMVVFGKDSDGRLYEVEEVYQTQRLVESWWVAEGRRIQKTYHPRKFVCDPSEPAYIQAFLNAGLPAIGGFNDIAPGIEAVQDRLNVQADGRPRLAFVADALVERDQTLADAFKPTCMDEEFDAYVWPTEKDGRPLKEVPVDEHNHALDALRYVVAYVDKIGEKRLRGNRTAVGPPREHKGAVAPTAPPRGKQSGPRPLSDPRKDYRIK